MAYENPYIDKELNRRLGINEDAMHITQAELAETVRINRAKQAELERIFYGEAKLSKLKEGIFHFIKKNQDNDRYPAETPGPDFGKYTQSDIERETEKFEKFISAPDGIGGVLNSGIEDNCLVK